MVYLCCLSFIFSFFFFNDTATTEIYTLSLHDALPISAALGEVVVVALPAAGLGATLPPAREACRGKVVISAVVPRSEEHTSELQSLAYLVCRLLLEKKKKLSERDPLWPPDLHRARLSH